METAALEKTIEKGIKFLSEFLPLKTYLYFPLLYASLFWVIKRPEEWREKIFSWKVFPASSFIKVKSDEFILNFFEDNQALYKAYEPEIKKRNLRVLREAAGCLYRILGLEDPFLSSLFLKELEEGDFRKIVKEFDERVSQAVEDIEALEDEPRLLKALETFANEMVSLGGDLLSQDKILKMLADLIKEKIKEKND
jgi:hypothetical protein